MIVDGKGIAEGVYEKLRERVRTLGRAPTLSIITCAPTFETQKYLALKKRKASEVGIDVNLIELDPSSTTDDFIACMDGVAPRSDGLIVQLPIPPHVDVDQVLRGVPVEKDVDALNPRSDALSSPVVGAFREILRVHNVPIEGKRVTVVGRGRLVGLPSERWFTREGAKVSVVTRDSGDLKEALIEADIIASGAGVPGLITSDMLKDHVVLLDAGTSEEGGELRGDADPECREKAALFTPVPGGVGPVTIAILLSNVVDCALKKERML